MTNAVVVALIGLIIIIAVHISIIARWSGRIDAFMQGVREDFERVEHEIARLRDARHVADGTLQRHDAMIRELNRRHYSRRSTDGDQDERERDR